MGIVEPRFRAGDSVQTPLGKGVVREARSGGWLLIEVKGRSVVLDDAAVAPLDDQRRRRTKDTAPTEAASAPSPDTSAAVREVDLHGLTVEDALARAEQALNDALLADASELRLIHGRSGGRIRAALHRRLGEISAVHAFRLDPRNAGVTVVHL